MWLGCFNDVVIFLWFKKEDIWNAICLIVLLPSRILISDHNKAFSETTYIDRNQNDLIFILSKSLWTDLGVYLE